MAMIGHRNGSKQIIPITIKMLHRVGQQRSVYGEIQKTGPRSRVEQCLKSDKNPTPELVVFLLKSVGQSSVVSFQGTRDYFRPLSGLDSQLISHIRRDRVIRTKGDKMRRTVLPPVWEVSPIDSNFATRIKWTKRGWGGDFQGVKFG